MRVSWPHNRCDWKVEEMGGIRSAQNHLEKEGENISTKSNSRQYHYLAFLSRLAFAFLWICVKVSCVCDDLVCLLVFATKFYFIFVWRSCWILGRERSALMIESFFYSLPLWISSQQHCAENCIVLLFSVYQMFWCGYLIGKQRHRIGELIFCDSIAISALFSLEWEK